MFKYIYFFFSNFKSSFKSLKSYFMAIKVLKYESVKGKRQIIHIFTCMLTENYGSSIVVEYIQHSYFFLFI